ncbi:DUF4013 domain-containing protein [Spirosoma fluviale]|uniref:Patatin-like phospholipase n=1 Tax=Spirosoma fluviale TaxID=1597977 RepID=A0A286G3Q4_9BACT|nr:DUF4013 domain-containing protein [Spirosoma fluviale]SOD90135.1 Patatin-like phospholipase [Spirosoma fluviale]
MPKPPINYVNRSLRFCEMLEEEYDHLCQGNYFHGNGKSKSSINNSEKQLTEIELRNTAELLKGLEKWFRDENKSVIPSPNEIRYKELAEWLMALKPITGDITSNKKKLVKFIKQILEGKLEEDLVEVKPWMRDASLRPYTRGLLKHYDQQRAKTKSPKPEEKKSLVEDWLPDWAILTKGAAVDRKLLNRLLLEDAYVGYIHRIDDQRLERIFAKMYDRHHTALCLSGGGIRSATFALGVVQGLVKNKVLDKFTYLSTVSGGGYLGSWLSAWIHHEGFDEVNKKLRCHADTPIEPEAAPVRHLRQYSNYLSPEFGLLSADTWTLFAIYLRNLLLLWLVIIPFLAAITAIPWLIVTIVNLKAGYSSAGVFTTSSLAALCTVYGTRFIHEYRPRNIATYKKKQVRESKRDQSAFLLNCLLPLCCAIFFWMLAWRWFEKLPPDSSAFLQNIHTSLDFNGADGIHLFSYGGFVIMMGTTLAHFLGWLIAIRFQLQHSKVLEIVAVAVTGAIAGLLLLLTGKLLLLSGLSSNMVLYTCLAAPGFMLSLLIAGYIFEGIISLRTDDAEREWTARYSGWLLIVAIGWFIITGLVLYGLDLTRTLIVVIGLPTTAGVGIGSGILTAFLGQNSKTNGDEKDQGHTNVMNLSRLLSKLALPIVAVITVLALFIGLSLADMALIRYVGFQLDPLSFRRLDSTTLSYASPWLSFSVLVVLFLIGSGFGLVVSTNKFSLHALYRMRLIRTYLGASRPPGERQPDPFTGFDETDNIDMKKLSTPPPSFAKSSPKAGKEKASGRRNAPFHVINIALNLVAGRNLAWQERKAESFTVTSLHAGAMYLGYRRTGQKHSKVDSSDARCYGGKTGITLGTAMTISGAAASPNQGYNSSLVIGFLMTLFNVRLGWWLGNPGPAGDDTFYKSGPIQALRPIYDEMIGNTDDVNPYVYLSDGGHFENLGLYEMVSRRNRVILVSDAGCDESCNLEDLGNAIRKVRIDLGISIDFPLGFTVRSRTAVSPKHGKYLAIGRIRYSEGPSPGDVPKKNARTKHYSANDGILLYIKPGFYGHEPRDIFNYASAKKAFPHESTSDQFFSESQFESYRALGAYVIERVKADLKTDFNLTLDDFFDNSKWENCIDVLNQKIKNEVIIKKKKESPKANLPKVE